MKYSEYYMVHRQFMLLVSGTHSTDSTIDVCANFKQLGFAKIQFCMLLSGINVLFQVWYTLHKSYQNVTNNTTVLNVLLPQIYTKKYHFGGIFQTIP